MLLLAEGDDLCVEPGEQHDVFALSDAVIFVSSQKATPFRAKALRSGPASA